MSRDDWLFDDGRRATATERIYAMATELVVRDGFDAFSIDALAARTHCSRATIYRYVGGKKDIRDAVLARTAARIIEAVRASVEGRRGPERVLTAIEVAVAEIRSDPAGQLFLDSARGGGGWIWLSASPVVADFATELTGLAGDDAPAARWIVRLVLSLLFLPDADPLAEHQMLQRFVAPAFAESAGPQSS
jgi:AcrR family transcriptional regulator